jgi:hypothetical protein
MSGRMSRNKGGRVERLLVAELKKLGWTDVYRIPLRGSYQKTTGHCKPDVIGFAPLVRRNVKFEVKARKDLFKAIYDLIDGRPDDTANIIGYLDPAVGIPFTISYSIEALLSGGSLTLFQNDAKMCKKIMKTKEWLGESDILALKQDHKPFLFVRFYA